MTIYRLTDTGRQFASNPYGGDPKDPRWQAICHLRMHNGQASDQSIMQGVPMNQPTWDKVRSSLVQMQPPLISVMR